jgi:hypothetical protein
MMARCHADTKLTFANRDQFAVRCKSCYNYIVKILSAKPLPDFRVELSFDNGETGVVDLSSFAGRGVFAAWDEPDVFQRVAVTAEGALEWPGEIDLCPDSLYLRMTGREPGELFPRLRERVTNA